MLASVDALVYISSLFVGIPFRVYGMANLMTQDKQIPEHRNVIKINGLTVGVGVGLRPVFLSDIEHNLSPRQNIRQDARLPLNGD